MVAPLSLIYTYNSGIGSKASIYLRTFVFLSATSIRYAFTLRPKDSKGTLALSPGGLANSSNVRNERANWFLTVIIIAIIKDLFKEFSQTLGFSHKFLCINTLCPFNTE
jgi:hypothetical protein